jgi:HlyD family secretion protein
MRSNHRKQQRSRSPLPVLCLAAVLLPAAATGCARQAPAETVAPPPTVTVGYPQRQTLRRVVEQPGWIEAFEQTPLFARITGYVRKVNVEMGARVRRSEVLAELSVPEREEELAHKQALVTQAGIEVKQAEQALRVAAASVQTAASQVTEARAAVKRTRANRDRWQSEYTRMAALVQSRVLDEQSRDETQNQFRAAEAALEEAEARVRSAEAAHSESQAKKAKAEADLEAARNRVRVAEADSRYTAALLEYAQIRAPFDGVVVRRHVDTGHFLQPGVGGKGAEPLFVVCRTDTMRIFVDVPEADAVLVKDGGAARIRLQALGDQEIEGKIAGTSWALEPGQRTLRTEIDLPNPDGKLRPGMYAYANIPIEQPGAMTLPASAVVLVREGQSFCYCLEGERVVRTPLLVGGRAGSVVEVLKKQAGPAGPGEKPRWTGLSGAEQVVLCNPGELTDGQTVTVSPRR